MYIHHREAPPLTASPLYTANQSSQGLALPTSSTIDPTSSKVSSASHDVSSTPQNLLSRQLCLLVTNAVRLAPLRSVCQYCAGLWNYGSSWVRVTRSPSVANANVVLGRGPNSAGERGSNQGCQGAHPAKGASPNSAPGQTPPLSPPLDLIDTGKGLKVQTATPHLVSLGSGRLSVAITVLPLSEAGFGSPLRSCSNDFEPLWPILRASAAKLSGVTRIGREDAPVPQDITIEGPGIEAEHCQIHNRGGVITLDPCGNLCSLDGVPVTTPTQLTQENLITKGAISGAAGRLCVFKPGVTIPSQTAVHLIEVFMIQTVGRELQQESR
ncbi:hypothetical protein JZ751_014983 [Albula glossodonta]|uniref:FHA domain-containing protein n=1 Tax=Albula glossodonta TaxID=121402 RepID=A0A8T2N7A7_9TELE|nr:hypothetical protein JZ751_014983 [Albula glossodonta]